MKKTISFLVMLMSLSLFSIDNDIEVTIFFTNDTNGHPLAFTYMEGEEQGGIPARATLIKELSEDKKRQNILILDAGGIIRGRSESNLYQGMPDIMGMNNIRYDAACVGISELWYSLDFFNELKRRANFTFLSANARENSEKSEYITDRYTIEKVGGFNGIKVGIFSVITEDAYDAISDEAKKEIVFDDPIETAKEIVTELTGKVDVIIALTHLGYYPDNSKIGSRILAKKVNGIDIIIDGRTGLGLREPDIVNNTRICQSLKWGLFLGEINFKIADGKVLDFQYDLHPVNYKENKELIGNLIEEDRFVSFVLNSRMINFDRGLDKNIAVVPEGQIDTTNIRNNENAFGNLICDALLDYTKADVAFQNAGGIDENVISTTEVTRRTFEELIKYDNSVVVVTTNGYNIKKILEYSMERIGSGGFLQIGGIRFFYSKSSKKITNIEVKSEPLEDTKVYNVAINSWLASGGDGYKIFKQIVDKIDLNVIHREVVYDYIEKTKEFNPSIDGRINITD